MRGPADGELQLLGGAVGVGRLQVFVGDDDALAPAAQVRHRAGAPSGGQGRGGPVHPVHLNTAGRAEEV